MTSVEFEKMLSARPAIFYTHREPCIRDLIFDYIRRSVEDDEEARLLTKEYTDALAQMMGVK